MFNIENITLSDVPIKYLDDFNEFDILYSENIIFVNLFDASANTTVIECIVRNTPIVINRLEAVEDYLGKDYPLFFNDINEVPMLLNNYKKIYDAYLYLKEMNKDDLKINHLIKLMASVIN
jgi:hypothetical protein